MKTFTQEKKQEVLAIAKENQEQDMFVQGHWLSDKKGDLFRGCFFGCMTQTEENTLEEAHTQLKIPRWIIHVSEKIFEGLPAEEAILFPVQLIEAIQPNSDTYGAYKRWSYELLMDDEFGQICFSKGDDNAAEAIRKCAKLFICDGDINIEEAGSAGLVARSSVLSAAGSARSAARSAGLAAESAGLAAELAGSAAELALSAAESAERSSEESAERSSALSARSAARSARSCHFKWMRDLLIKVLSEK